MPRMVIQDNGKTQNNKKNEQTTTLKAIGLNFTISSYQNFHRVILKVRFPLFPKSAIPNSGFFPPEV